MKKIICLLLMLTFVLSMTTVAYASQNNYTIAGDYLFIEGSDEKGEIFCVFKDGKYGYVDKNGKIILDLSYDRAGVFSSGLAYVEKDGKHYYINKTGKMVIDLKSSKYKNCTNIDQELTDEYFYGDTFSGDYAFIHGNYNTLIIDKNGKVLDYPKDIIIGDGEIVNDICTAESNDFESYGYYNIRTKKFILGYSILNEFNNGLSVAEKDELIYLIDQNLNEKCTNIKYKFYDYIEINDKYIQVSNRYQFGDEQIIATLYTTEGKQLLPYDKYFSITPCSDEIVGFKLIGDNDKYGIMNVNGNVLVEPKFKYFDGFYGDHAVASIEHNKYDSNATFGIVDKKGEFIVPQEFSDVAIDKRSHQIYVKNNGKWSILSLTIDKPASWAEEEVKKAIDAKLIPEELKNNYASNITREDFCKLTIALVEAKSGKTIDQILEDKNLSLDDNPFTDTTSKTIIAANKLNIVNGKGNGIFEPNGFITRQEAAVMLTNVAKTLGAKATSQGNKFADNNSIAKWALDAVNYVSGNNVMKGTDKGFEPLSTYTKQQAYLTIYRLFDLL